jgi:hypothetical protein
MSWSGGRLPYSGHGIVRLPNRKSLVVRETDHLFPVVDEGNDICVFSAAKLRSSQRPTNHLRKQDAACCLTGQKYRLYRRHIRSFSQHLHVDNDIQLAISKPLQNATVLILGPFVAFVGGRQSCIDVAIDNIGANIAFCKRLAKVVALMPAISEHEGLSVFLTSIRVGVGDQVVSLTVLGELGDDVLGKVAIRRQPALVVLVLKLHGHIGSTVFEVRS